MNISLLQAELEKVHSKLKETALSYGPNLTWYQPDGKWSPAQNLKHVELSILPVSKLLSDKQKFFSRDLGTTHGGSRSFTEIMKIYKESLSGGNIKSPDRFVPVHLESEISILIRELDERVCQLISGLNNFSEEEIDFYQIPHPLIGQLTIREMIYFYVYHAGHHENNIIKNMNAVNTPLTLPH